MFRRKDQGRILTVEYYAGNIRRKDKGRILNIKYSDRIRGWQDNGQRRKDRSSEVWKMRR